MGLLLNVQPLPEWVRDGAEAYLAGASDAELTGAAQAELVIPLP